MTSLSPLAILRLPPGDETDMPGQTDALVVLTTCPNQEAAGLLAARLVESRLAACVNVIGGVRSVYRWQGRVEQDNEVLLLIKSSEKVLAAVRGLIEELSDYELPEVLAVPVKDGSSAYLNWLLESLDGKDV
jgi:periplasmic divalent cation tolerance protein